MRNKTKNYKWLQKQLCIIKLERLDEKINFLENVI